MGQAADPGDDACHLLDRAGRGVDVGAAQPGSQQVATAEDIERQVAVAVVIAVEEAAFLVAVQRIVGGIQVEHDLLGRLPMRLHEQVDEQALDGAGIMADLVVARRCARAQFQPVERRFAGHRRTILAARRKLAGQQRHHRIVAQHVMIDQVLVA